MLMSLAIAACDVAAQPSWTLQPNRGAGAGPADPSPSTQAPTGSISPTSGAGAGQPVSSTPTLAPPGSASPISGNLQPDPNAEIYHPRDPKAPALLPGTTHDIDLRIDERFNSVAQGFVQHVWTFGGTDPGSGMVPGPVIRVQVGDTIRIHLINHPPTLPGLAAIGHPAVNDFPHSVDFHGSTGAWNDQMTPIKPGEEKVFEFKAEFAGVWMYHGNTEPVLQNIAYGMYGMLIVEPKGGLDKVDQEFFLVQGEWYLGGQYPSRPPSPSLAKAAAAVPVPDFVVFNGIADQYSDHPIQVETGKRVRAFILDAGPNLSSSFSVEGSVFDRVIKEGIELKVGNRGSWGSQAVDLSPGQGAIVELTMAEDGLYPIVTHALNLAGRGAVGLFQAGATNH